MPDDKRVDRRHFFRAALGELFDRATKASGPLERALHHLGSMDETPPARADSTQSAGRPVLRLLRPPGALAEEQFIDQCSRCGECVRVCPAQCIKIEPGGRGDGAPFIDVDEMPCVLCDGLLCMNNCPSGALVPTLIEAIDMGTALWKPDLCARTQDQECTICIDRCPVGSRAIELRAGRVHVIEEGCVGCGVCEYYCPTIPKAITVTPRAG